MIRILGFLLAMLVVPGLHAAGVDSAGAAFGLSDKANAPMSTPLQLTLLLTLLSLLPTLLIATTAFTRYIIVLAMLRHAIGMPDTPPNMVLVSLALMLTGFTMAPVWEKIQTEAATPYLQGQISEQRAYEAASRPLKDFMLRQVREKDVALILELSHSPAPATAEELTFGQLIPAFMLGELRRAFEIGFIIFLPFLLIDLIVSTVLMSLGMIMVPPQTVSLPLKVLLFVLIDGWSLLAASLVRSFAV